MSWLRFFHCARRDAELTKDIHFYLDTETEDNVARGIISKASIPNVASRGGQPTRWLCGAFWALKCIW